MNKIPDIIVDIVNEVSIFKTGLSKLILLRK